MPALQGPLPYRGGALRQGVAAAPKAAADLEVGQRYNAACVAALAATGKGNAADKLDGQQQSRLRKQALDWLQENLVARGKLLETDPVRVFDDMKHWQHDADLAGLREEKELAKLPADERAASTKFWGEVDRLAKQARATFTETDHKGHLSTKERERNYPIQMTAGKTYVIDMESPDFDTFLRLEDDKGKVLAENDDISPTSQNSRIVFIARADGAYRIVATSFEQRGVGTYTVTVRRVRRQEVDLSLLSLSGAGRGSPSRDRRPLVEMSPGSRAALGKVRDIQSSFCTCAKRGKLGGNCQKNSVIPIEQRAPFLSMGTAPIGM